MEYIIIICSRILRLQIIFMKIKGFNMTVCTFAGHRDVYQAGLEAEIEKVIGTLLQTDKEFVFFTGGMGHFDDMCSSAVRAAKRRYADLNISLILVMPYMSNRLNTDKDYYEYLYDEILIPSDLADVHYKAAIKKRNKWMVDKADCVIAYVYREAGGAFETVKYAQKNKKRIINLAKKDLNVNKSRCDN